MVLQEPAIEGNRNFINKLWNATKFHLIYVEKLSKPPELSGVKPSALDQWIVARLNDTATAANRHLEDRRFNEACQLLYHFAWNDFCDWYLEISKPILNGDEGAAAQTAAHACFQYVLGQILKLLHPFMPFVTEELWQALGNAESIMIQPYPAAAAAVFATTEERNPRAEQEVATLIEVIQAIRNVRGEHGIKPKQRIPVVLKGQPAQVGHLNENSLYRNVVTTLAGLETLRFNPEHRKQQDEAHGVGTGFEVFVNLTNLIDHDAERQRLAREIDKLRPQVDKLAAKLGNPAFVDKAPATVVAKNREELAGLQAQLDKLGQSLSQLGA
jgi:valyl-tRNA synthetase